MMWKGTEWEMRVRCPPDPAQESMASVLPASAAATSTHTASLSWPRGRRRRQAADAGAAAREQRGTAAATPGAAAFGMLHE